MDGYQIMDRVPDRGGVPGRVPIWPPLPSNSTEWHETLTSHQSDINSLIFLNFKMV